MVERPHTQAAGKVRDKQVGDGRANVKSVAQWVWVAQCVQNLCESRMLHVQVATTQVHLF